MLGGLRVLRRGMGGSTRFSRPSPLRVALASAVIYAKDVIAYYSLGGFVLVRLSVPLFMVATAWAIDRVTGGGGLVAKLGYEDYVAYVALGFAFFGLMTTTLFEVGERIHREMVQGTLEVLLAAPASRAAWLAGTALGSLAISLVDMTLVILYYIALFGAGSIHLGLIHHAAAVVLLGVAGMMGLGVLLAGLIVNLKEPHAFNVLMTPFLMLLSGMMFPVEALPSLVSWASQLIPLTHAIESLRLVLLQGSTIGEVSGLLGILAGQGLIYGVLGYIVFKAQESRARRSGGLGKF